MQCFSINSKEIKERFDPKFLISFKKLSNKMASNIYYRPLSDFLLCPPQYGANESAKEWTEDSKYRYIRITDIDEFGNLKQDDIKTAEKIDLKYELQENDILFARSGATTGKCFIYKTKYGKAIFAGYLIRFKIDPVKLNPEFLFYYTQTNYYKEWVNSIQRPVGQPNINSKEFCELKIPVFYNEQGENLEIQNKIVKIMQQGYENKLKKEQEAEEILNSTEKFILEKLEILPPDIKDKRVYTVKAKDIKNKRLDVYGYQPVPRTIIKAIKQSKYEKTIAPLNSLILENFAGDWGEDIERDLNDNYSICNVIRNKNFNNVYNIDYEDIAQRKILNTKKEKILLKKGDILIEKSGGSPQQPVGRVAYIDNDITNYTFSNFLQCIRISTELCDPEYLFIYLRTIYKLNYMKYIQSQTTGIINLLMDDFLNIPIILLKDKDAQREIVDKYNEMQNKAKQLQKEAKDEFEKAKAEVEKMILGEV